MTYPQTLAEWRELLKDHPDGIEVEWVNRPNQPERWRVKAVGAQLLLGETLGGDWAVQCSDPAKVRPVRRTLTIEISEDDADWWEGEGWNPSARAARLADAIRKAREAQQ